MGPFLFNLYINDLKDIMSRFKGQRGTLSDSVAHLVYADNLQVYTQATRDNLHEGIDCLSAVAWSVSTWASDNALQLNSEKTEAIIFGSDYNINLLQGMNFPGSRCRITFSSLSSIQ